MEVREVLLNAASPMVSTVSERVIEMILLLFWNRFDARLVHSDPDKAICGGLSAFV